MNKAERSMKGYIFECSRSLWNQAEDLQNFTWPTLAALYHFHDNVSQEVAHGATAKDLKLKFFDSVGVQVRRTGFNTSFISFTHEELANRLATHHLFDLVGLYEAWIDAIVEIFASRNIIVPGAKDGMQIPTSMNGSSGIRSVLSTLQQRRSRHMEQNIYPAAKQHSKYSLAHLDNLMITYRGFKELRNAIVHLGGIADQRRENASKRYEALSASDLGLTEKPELPPMRIGQQVCMTLPGVGGLSETILRIVTTVDTELAVTDAADDELWNRWKRHHGDGQILWAPVEAQMVARMRHYAQHSRIPVPADPLTLIPWLQQHGVGIIR